MWIWNVYVLQIYVFLCRVYTCTFRKNTYEIAQQDARQYVYHNKMKFEEFLDLLQLFQY